MTMDPSQSSIRLDSITGSSIGGSAIVAYNIHQSDPNLFAMYFGIDPAGEKMSVPALEDIALRLDEIAAEHPEIPDLTDIHELLTKHFAMHENAQETIAHWKNEYANLQAQRGSAPVDSYNEWRKREQRELLDRGSPRYVFGT